MLQYPKLKENASSDDKATQHKNKVLNDFWIASVSREASVIGRKEVLNGKAKFGILGDGKEIPQVALAHFFEKGDFRSGYYRDQTWMMALGICNIQEYFAQLYADPQNDPFSAGRQMNNHFATPMIDGDDNWLRHTDRYNISADISSTGGQMARALGLAFASTKYKNIEGLDPESNFSRKGKEVVWCSIGDASTSEGIFWEALNAASVVKLPLVVLVWDDGYGISVPVSMQTTKGSISDAAEGFRVDKNGDGILIYKVKAWDYAGLINVFDKVSKETREDHTTVLIHIEECTQPQGHSTSGSHERYKSEDRLAWEREYDGIKKMGEWIVDSGIATQEQVDKIIADSKVYTKEESKKAWSNYQGPVKQKKALLGTLYKELGDETYLHLKEELNSTVYPTYGEIVANARTLQHHLINDGKEIPQSLEVLIEEAHHHGDETYRTNLYSSSSKSALNVPVVAPVFSENSESINGYTLINKFFDIVFDKYPNTVAFGEDVGNIGGVNQGFAGLQDKYGKDRVFDSGIREWSIIGGAIGLAMRGLRPIAEIQYLDYLIYAMSPLSDDLATLRYRSNGQQMAPAIIRTRGHRLEGIWHAGSPLGMMINALRGIYICVPRNFTQAAGMYNTLLQSSDPGIVIEVLNGYRIKETLPDNLGEYTVPLGVPEILNRGEDLTIVTYGPNVRYVQEAIARLDKMPFTIELIDVQTLLPFDLEHVIGESIKKTNRLLVIDEDVPGASAAYILQKILEEQDGYYHLDAKPRTLSSKEHRTPFGSDGDYFTKPQVGDIIDVILEVIAE